MTSAQLCARERERVERAGRFDAKKKKRARGRKLGCDAARTRGRAAQPPLAPTRATHLVRSYPAAPDDPRLGMTASGCSFFTRRAGTAGAPAPAPPTAFADAIVVSGAAFSLESVPVAWIMRRSRQWRDARVVGE